MGVMGEAFVLDRIDRRVDLDSGVVQGKRGSRRR